MKRSATSLLLLWLLLNSFSNAYSSAEASSPARLTNDASVIIQPDAGALVGNDLKVGVTISSTFEIKSVKGNVEGRETALVFSNTAICDKFGCKPGWAGNISLAGLSRGQKLLTVTATDVFDNAAQVQRTFTYDQPPILTVAAPLAETVARPSLFIDARCTDDDPAGCSSIVVSNSANGSILASGQSSINGFIFLSQYDGQNITLVFRAQDSRGQTTSVSRPIFVESSNNLTEIESVSGHIIDVQPDRMLFLENTDGAYVLKIEDRSSGQDAVVMNDPANIPQYGFLTPKGAIFMTQSGNILTSKIYEWRDGTLIDLGFPNSAQSLSVKGTYAIWSVGNTLIRRDLISGTNLTVSDSAGNINNDVSANGDVVYWTNDYNVYRYRQGVNTMLAHDSNLWNTYPLTDGINVVYRKHTPCCLNQSYAIVTYGQSGELILAPARAQETTPMRDYQSNGAWIAFTRLGNVPLQVWTRSPAGVESQISFFGTSSFIKGLSPKGGVVFSDFKRSYLKEPDSPTVDLHSSLGQDFWQNELWFVSIGRTLFRANTAPDPVPTLLTEISSQRAIALNAVTFLGGPFPIITGPQNLSPDQRTRVMLLASNISLMPGDNTSAILAQAEDSQHRLYQLPVEYIGRVPDFDWLTQVHVTLPDELKGAGDVWISIDVRGVISNRALVSIK